MAEGENAGFCRLLELLHGSYLRRGVRSSVASRLEQVYTCTVFIDHVLLHVFDHLQSESRLQSAKKHYLEHSLLHSELSAVLTCHSLSAHKPPPKRTRSSDVRVGREVLGAGEAQHCLQLQPETSLLGLTTDHLRHTGGRPLSGVSEYVYVCVCIFKGSV